jgi:hyperosmotically inducible periplasmic protein
MRVRTLIRNLTIGLAVLAFAGAGILAVPASAQNVSHLSQQQGQGRYEAWLSQQVQHRLASLPWYGVFDNLEYKIEGSRVILLGQVVNPSIKSDAENSVKRIEGVSQVENEIQVLPLSSFDNQIRRAEYRAIFSEPSLSRYSMGAIPSIHIIVDNGHVTLVGYVSNQVDRTLAGLRAKTVPNVFSVTNHLRIG